MRELLEQESKENGLRYLEVVLRYLMNATNKITREEMLTVVKDVLSETGGKTMLTLAEQWIQEGFERGKLEGELKGKLEGKLEGLAEAIELGISLRFGDEFLDDIMPFVRTIHKPEQLELIKNAIKRAQDISELKAIIVNSN